MEAEALEARARATEAVRVANRCSGGRIPSGTELAKALCWKARPQYEGVTDIFTFSDVYFSKNGRLALTALSSWCSGLCGQHQWKVFEKLSTGEWREQPSWVRCFTISEQRYFDTDRDRSLERIHSSMLLARSFVRITRDAPTE
jgi:hypothetical protein